MLNFGLLKDKVVIIIPPAKETENNVIDITPKGNHVMDESEGGLKPGNPKPKTQG